MRFDKKNHAQAYSPLKTKDYNMLHVFKSYGRKS